jgi:hypothetical protein
MKSLVLFVATSLILVVAMVAIALPNPVEANKNFEWCSSSAPQCYDKKKECKDALEGIANPAPCVKVLIE